MNAQKRIMHADGLQVTDGMRQVLERGIRLNGLIYINPHRLNKHLHDFVLVKQYQSEPSRIHVYTENEIFICYANRVTAKKIKRTSVKNGEPHAL